MQKSQSFRLTYLLGLILIALLLGSAYYIEIFDHINPCPLCLLQRMCMAALGVIFIIGAFVKFKKCAHLFLGFLGFIVSISGLLLAGRQVWLQYSPPSTSGDCSASLSYLYDVLSIKDLLIQVWKGGMECSQTGGQFLHLSLAAWSLIAFSILFFMVLVQIIRAIKK